SPRQAVNPLPGVFISNRGLTLPALEGDALDWMLWGLGLAIVAAIVLGHWARKRQETTGHLIPVGRITLFMLLAFPLLGWLFSGAALEWEVPELKGFNFAGGITLTPEFAALLAGLVIYASAF